MTDSYEFLAAFGDWQRQCRQAPLKIDSCPVATEKDNFERVTLHAELLKTLTAFEDLKQKATDGKKVVLGYPGLLKGGKLCDMPTIGGKRSWKSLLLPEPGALRLLPDGSCLLQMEVKLTSPFFSRDDRVFYPTDNVLKRHHVFLTPYLAASGLKGLLRWAWRLSGQSDEDGGFVFGTATDDRGGESRQGLLYLWPLYWIGKVGLDVINPQDRVRGAGTTPIKYEVVLPESKGSVYMLLVNRDNTAARLLPKLLDAFWFLLDHGGFSAKSSAGWGQAKFVKGCLAVKGLEKLPQAAASSAAKPKPGDKCGRWKDFLDEKGELIGFDEKIFTKKVLERLGITAVKFKRAFNGDAKKAYEAVREKGEWRADCADAAKGEKPADKAVGLNWLVMTNIRTTFMEESKTYMQEMAKCQR